MDAIGRLAGGIAHDFYNILVPIIGYVELTMMNLDTQSRLYANLKHVRQAIDRAAGLTRQILTFGRKQVLEMRVIDLNAVVADFGKMVKRLIGEDIELRTFLEPDLYPVKADKGQLEQVLLNLAVNARDAMPIGGKLTVETANVYLDEGYVRHYADSLPAGRYTMLAVSDTGHGMAPDIRQKVFEPFFTTRAQGKGTGLGLATVFGIVKQHGGDIRVYSEPGEGATFKIYLPRARDVVEPQDATPAESRAIHGTETVFVVEDDEMVCRLICETLTAHGYKVVEARSPGDALKRLSGCRETVHLLLTDVIMPDMNGKELYRRVAAVRPGIKVLYMSGYTDNIIVHHGILDEGIDFLQKPFTVHSLTQKIREVLG